eukprot:3613191-Pyramimonas_sp.AAC.1
MTRSQSVLTTSWMKLIPTLLLTRTERKRIIMMFSPPQFEKPQRRLSRAGWLARALSRMGQDMNT